MRLGKASTIRYTFTMQSIITLTLSLMLVAIPLTFTTVNFELFEFPKFLLLLTGTIVLFSAWAIDLFTSRRPFSLTEFWPRPGRNRLVAIAALAVLLTQAAAAIFSIDPHTSFWGYYSRFHQGLLTTICYTLIYLFALKYLDYKSTHKLIKISVITSLVISLYAILQRLGIDKNMWVQDVVNRPFSTLGQPNWLAAYLIPNIFLVLFLSISNNRKSFSSIVHYSLFIILFSALLLTKSRSGLIGFSLAYLTYWLLLARNLTFAKIRRPLIHCSSFIVLCSLLIGTPYTPKLTDILPSGSDPEVAQTDSPPAQGTQLESGGTESGDIRKIVWTGALHLLADKPLLGTGPETFAYSYYWTRPVSHNYTSEWDFLYNKAHNEYLNFAATSGLIGLAAYLAWHSAIFWLSLSPIPASKKAKKDEETSLKAYYPALAASLVSFTVTNFFGFSVIPVYLVMIVLTALPAGLSHQSPLPLPYSRSFLPSFTILASLFIILLPLRLFLADLNFAKGKTHLDTGQYASAETYLSRAVSLHGTETLYRSLLAETYAQSSAESDSPSEYLQLTLDELDYVAKHNPWHLNYRKSSTKAYLALSQSDPAYYQKAAAELTASRKLAPTDPKLAYNLGLVYSRLGQVNDSIAQMQNAIELKNNYYEPYYALTLLYEEVKQTNEIPALLKRAKANLSVIPAPLQTKLDQYLP